MGMLSGSVNVNRFRRKQPWSVSGYNSGNGLEEMRKITKALNKGNTYYGLGSNLVAC
jgi:hypothetical protein